MKEAEAACRKAVELAPEDARRWSALSRFLREHKRDLSGARAAAERAVRLDATDTHAWHALGWTCRVQGNQERAAEAWLTSARCAQDPQQKAGALMSASTPLMDLGRTDDALAAAREAIELLPDDPAVHRQWGALMIELNRFAEAIGAARKSIAVGGDERSYELLGSALAKDDAFRGAIAAMRKAIELGGENLPRLQALVQWQLDAGDYDDALQACDAAIRHGAGGLVWAARAALVLNLGDLDAALALCKEAEKKAPHPQVHFRLGRFCSSWAASTRRWATCGGRRGR